MPSFCCLFITDSNCRTASKGWGMLMGRTPGFLGIVKYPLTRYPWYRVAFPTPVTMVPRNLILQRSDDIEAVSYTHLRAHETDSYLVCRLLLEKKKKKYYIN